MSRDATRFPHVDGDRLEAHRLARRLDASPEFQLLSRALTDVVLIVDESGTIAYAGGGVRSALGVGRDRLVGSALHDLVNPDDQAVLPRPLVAGGPWDVRLHVGDKMQWASVVATDPATLGAPGDGLAEDLAGYLLVFVRPVGGAPVAGDRADLFRRALDAFDTLLFVSDVTQEGEPIVFANQHFLDATGYSRAEVIGQSARFLQARPDGTHDEQEGTRALALALGQGRRAHARVRSYAKSGRPFWSEVYATPILDASGRVSHVVRVFDEVAVAGRAPRPLHMLVDEGPLLTGVVGLDPSGTLSVESANAPARDLGLDPSAARPLPDAEAAAWGRHAQSALDLGESVPFQTVYPWGRTADEPGVRALQGVLSPVGPGAVSFVLVDAAARQAGLNERDDLVAAMDQAADAVIITDGHLDAPGPTIRYVNEAFLRMSGHTREDVIGRSPRIMQSALTDRSTLRRMKRLLAQGLPFHGELVNQTKDGAPYVVELDIRPLRDASGRIGRFVSTQRDVTKERQLEAEVLASTARVQADIARDLHDGVGQVLAGTAYHLHGLAQDLAEEGSAYASQAVRAAELVQQAQNHARTLAHGLYPVAVAGTGLATELERLAVEASQTYGIDCRFVCPTPVVLHPEERAADVYRIAQEALANAIRHGRPSAVEIRLRPPFGSEDGLASLVVQDDGVGISDSASGGIGVSTMRYRARRLGGTLEISAEPGGGTEVSVRFPLRPLLALPPASA